MLLSMNYKNASKWSLLVLLIGLLLSALFTWLTGRMNAQTIGQALRENTEQISENVLNRITLYQYGLRGARGSILSAGEYGISRASFHRYSLSRDVDQEFPGARGFGFIRRVPNSDEAAFLTRAKNDDWPDFNIRQLTPHSGEKYVIEYIEPIDRNRAAIGLDVASEAHRKAAADAAMLSGEVRLSAPITLVQATRKPLQSFLILQPIYRTISVPKTPQERLAAGYGWSYAPLVTNEVLTGLALNQKMTKLLLSDITQTERPISFFETHPDDASPLSAYSHTLTKEIFGRKWQVEVIAYPAFIQSLHLNQPSLVLLSGSLLSLLLAAFIAIWSISLQRKQQVQLEQARRASMLEHSLDAIISYDLTGNITSWNQGAEEIFGYTQTDVIGHSSCDLIIPPSIVLEEQVLFAEVFSGKTVLNQISTHQRQNGSHVSTSTTSLPIYDEDSAIVGLSQTIRDITTQQEAERYILSLNARLEQEVTKRTNALQQALLENQTLLDTINQQLLYSATDPNGVILEVNDNFCHVSGYSRKQLLGETHAILNSGEHDAAFWRTMWTQIKSGLSWHGEICNRDRHQMLKWFDTVIGPVFNENGNIERFVALRTDITERKLAQIEKNKLGSLLTNVLDAASEMSIIATDKKGVITIFNRGAEQLLGYAAVDMIGLSTPAPLHLPEEVAARSAELSSEYGEDIQGFDVFVYKARTLGSETRTWTYVRKDTSQCQVSLSVTAMLDNVGEIIGYLGIAIDISQVLQQQKALITASNHLSKAAEVAKLGIWSWDLRDNSLEWNERMFAIYDHPLSLQDKGLTYEHWRMRIHSDDIDFAEAKLKAAIEEKDQYDPIFRVVRTDGTIRYVQAAAQIERDVTGQVTKVIGINLDITEQRQLEETLREAKHEADAANAAKSAFLANMSHEIRTPMNAVLGMLQLMQHTSMSVQQQDYVSKTQTAAKSLLGLLNDILDFSKIDAGKLTLDLHPCSIELLMRDLAIVLSGNHGNKNVEVMFDLDPALPAWLLADQLRLQQILVNLAGNALKFTRHGQVTVAMECLRHEVNTVTVQISISDTGIGISEEQIERIFTGFEQAESSTSRRFGGTGLGLAISKKLVELMGGQLNVTSRVGVGSRFWFDVTFCVMEVEATHAIDLSGYHILIVDDNPLTVEILHKILTYFGCSAETASGGYQALEKVKQANTNARPFDVVLMDWRMPDLDGLQTADLICNSHSDSPIPLIVMLTAYGHEVISESQHIKNVPFVNFLTKPVTSQILAEAIINAIEGKTMTVNPTPHSQRRLSTLAILVVEDNQLNRQVIDELLSYEGANVQLANGGVEGVFQVLESGNVFDIVIMDIQMPDMDGLAATRLIRADSRFAELPILAMTANASQSDKQDCFDAGMNDHVGKPIDMQILLPSILRLVGQEEAPSLAQQHQPAELQVPLDDMPLLDDIQLILRRFGGNQAFFQKMAKGFAPEMLKQLNLFKQSTKVFEYATAAAVGHGIKGLASNFGALRLAAYAAFLEKQLKQNDLEFIEIKVWTEQLELLINESTQQLSTYIPQPESTVLAQDKMTQAIDSQALMPSAWTELNALMLLLKANNLEAMTFVDRLIKKLPHHPQWITLQGQVQALEFDKASDTLRIIMLENK
ncbi:multi-sensor hybrid histidine kinase [Shewanella baltica BA175]|uniref:PAS domain S-box protein n=1 Tax=Shewanella baltica TaxID=62322 RepID=UPI0001E4C77E|nr:PAS domain S-box protein [Shewanella baltica]AEG09441.1 multi-sensor hybrid histidine kinase [Shewanella baltica BA175]